VADVGVVAGAKRLHLRVVVEDGWRSGDAV
jgi:hypothetical protein